MEKQREFVFFCLEWYLEISRLFGFRIFGTFLNLITVAINGCILPATKHLEFSSEK